MTLNINRGILIGLTGYAQHGKSSVAGHLVREHGFIKMSFADELKSMIKRVNPILSFENGRMIRLTDALEMTNGNEIFTKNRFPEYRRFMQALGTDGIRAADDNFWVSLLEEKIEDQFRANPQSRIVVDDVRFPNEAELFDPEWNSEATLWNVHRTGMPQTDGHASEQWAGKLDEALVIENDSDTQVLYNKVDRALESLVLDTPPELT